MSKFYEFSQNNSGGSFVINDKLCHRLYIEAASYPEARDKALGLGVYFDGCRDERDCDCCGDRWYDAEEVLEIPIKLGDKKFTRITDYAQHMADEDGWTEPDGRIFYKDGSIEEIYKGGKP